MNQGVLFQVRGTYGSYKGKVLDVYGVVGLNGYAHFVYYDESDGRFDTISVKWCIRI